MDKGIVEGSEDVGNAKYKLILSDLGTERDGVFFLGCLGFLGRLQTTSEGQSRDPPLSGRFGEKRCAIWDPNMYTIVKVKKTTHHFGDGGLRMVEWTTRSAQILSRHN